MIFGIGEHWLGTFKTGRKNGAVENDSQTRTLIYRFPNFGTNSFTCQDLPSSDLRSMTSSSSSFSACGVSLFLAPLEGPSSLSLADVGIDAVKDWSSRFFGSPSSLRPTMTLPATSKAAPTHHKGGRASEKITEPRTAVMTKLDDVFIMETCVVELPLARAAVKSVHI